MILKIEGKGNAELDAASFVAFEEIHESTLEARPLAKSSVFFDVGDGLNNHVVENSYDQVKGNTAPNAFQEIVLSGTKTRRMSIPRGSIVYKEDYESEDDEVEFPPKTLIKTKIGQQIITLATTLTRDELNMG